MNLVICSNYSLPQCGGSEIVIQQIAKYMAKKGANVTILSKNAPLNGISIDGISLCFCGSGPEQFIKRLQSLKPDHVLVYSDYFAFWPVLLSKINLFQFKVTLIPVGLNASIENGQLLHMLRKNKNRIEIVTHSKNYQDYTTCSQVGLKVKDVIPNGINLEEFLSDQKYFRNKYKIDTKHMLLCVANFFPGKGQEFLPKILSKVYNSSKDFTMVVLHSGVSFQLSKFLAKSVESALNREKFKSIMLCDLPRKDIIGAFFDADIFVFPSQKEVAPLVLLESMAASTPWVALNVGNASDLAGGKIVIGDAKDARGNITYNDSVINDFSNKVIGLLEDESSRKKLGKDGRKEIEEKYNWNTIGEQYYKALA